MKGNNILWAIVLVVAVALAIWSGWWALEVIAKVVIYVVLALVAIAAVMMIARSTQSGARGTDNHPIVH